MKRLRITPVAFLAMLVIIALLGACQPAVVQETAPPARLEGPGEKLSFSHRTSLLRAFA